MLPDLLGALTCPCGGPCLPCRGLPDLLGAAQNERLCVAYGYMPLNTLDD